MCDLSKTLSRRVAVVTVSAFRWSWAGSESRISKGNGHSLGVPVGDIPPAEETVGIPLTFKRVAGSISACPFALLDSSSNSPRKRWRSSPEGWARPFAGSGNRKKETTRGFPTRRESNRQVFQTEEAIEVRLREPSPKDC